MEEDVVVETNLILDESGLYKEYTKEDVEKFIKQYSEEIKREDGKIERHLYFDQMYLLCDKNNASYEKIEIYNDGKLEKQKIKSL